MTCEQDVLQVAMEWINFDLEKRMKYLDSILKLIQFPLINSKKLATLKNKIAEKSSIYTSLVLEAFKHHSDPLHPIPCKKRNHKLDENFTNCPLNRITMQQIQRLHGKPRLAIARGYKNIQGKRILIPEPIRYFLDVKFDKNRFVHKFFGLREIEFCEIEISEDVKQYKYIQSQNDIIVIGKAEGMLLAARLSDTKQDFKIHLIDKESLRKIMNISSFLEGCTESV